MRGSIVVTAPLAAAGFAASSLIPKRSGSADNVNHFRRVPYTASCCFHKAR
jgi:hypothetical protein